MVSSEINMNLILDGESIKCKLNSILSFRIKEISKSTLRLSYDQTAYRS